MEEVPCRTSLVPLASPCFVLCLKGVETEGFLDYQGQAGIISIVRPIIFGVEIFAENRRKPQIGLRHLSSVTFSSALYS